MADKAAIDMLKIDQFSTWDQIRKTRKPIIAAISGFALGGGCELAMATTFRIASDKAQFGQPEVKLGVIPGYGGTVRLARLVGKGRALDLCVTGRTINATTALDWGLVSEVVSDVELLTRADHWLNVWAQLPPLAMQAVMQCIDVGFDLSMEEALHLEALQFANICATQDKAEGVTAFLEKRVAVFRGK